MTRSRVSDPLIFTTYDIGRMTGTDPTTVHKWIDRGLLAGYRTPGGHRRVRGEDLRAFLVSHRIPVPKELGGTDALRVLVANGDVGATRSILRALKRLRPSWEVEAAASGVEALLTVSRDPPDVLALDLHLHEVDGLAVCRHLQGRPETATVKVLALAGRVSADVVRKARSAGASAVLKKPVAGAELVEAIELAIGLRPAAELA